ncbi:FAD-dependent monooxygenase [Neopusillimonas aromaticivorans]|nr:FAD-dependent monooxygenase [Neopusillimonas aromaticivorans]WJJ95027.1 FAD-dependent monooxygenase [Neopusillimonas aromaticivorans]
MHGAPFDMWRLDFQLLDGQDADEEMQPEKVHARIKAHFDMMGLHNIDYELVLTSIYRTNALSLPTYNKGRVLFAGDAAHQVPIFGGAALITATPMPTTCHGSWPAWSRGAPTPACSTLIPRNDVAPFWTRWPS